MRSASRDDAEPICAIYNAAIAERGSTFETEPRSAGDFESRIGDARLPLLVSDAGGGVAGWAGLSPYSGRPCYAGIGECSVYVSPEARGRGVGTALTEALASAAEESGFHKLLGKLFTDNIASVRLVERCSFRTVGVHRRHGRLDGAWRDVVVVERLLGSIDPLASEDSSLVELVEAVRSLAYGRPSDRSVEGMLRERRGTCSTKHLFLAEALARRFRETEPQIVHRVYRLDRDRACKRFGDTVATAIPDAGVVDVHRFLTATIGGKRITIDATFPGEPWDGYSSLPLACEPGEDHIAGSDPDAEKRALEAKHCDSAIRERFIAALSRQIGSV